MALQKKEIMPLAKDVAGNFKKHNGFKLSASLAFYTMFSLAPMLLVIIYISTIFLGRETAESGIYTTIAGIAGQEATEQIQALIKKAYVDSTDLMAVIGLIVLIIAATTSFMEVQSSLNVIWNLKLKKGSFWKQLLLGRLFSFSIVFGLGLLLFFSLLVNGLLEGFMDNFRKMYPTVAMTSIYIASQIIILSAVALLFTVVYKVLPYAFIRWREAAIGAICGALLFMIGKFLLGFLISKSGLNNAYGAAAALVIILVWIFYSAVTLYIGAEIAKTYAIRNGKAIEPRKYAYLVQLTKVEDN